MDSYERAMEWCRQEVDEWDSFLSQEEMVEYLTENIPFLPEGMIEDMVYGND